MGGILSGRRYHSGKDTTSNLRALDIRRLKQEGLLQTGKSLAGIGPERRYDCLN